MMRARGWGYSSRALVIWEEIRLQAKGCRLFECVSLQSDDADDACSWVGLFIAHSCEVGKHLIASERLQMNRAGKLLHGWGFSVRTPVIWKKFGCK